MTPNGYFGNGTYFSHVRREFDEFINARTANPAHVAVTMRHTLRTAIKLMICLLMILKIFQVSVASSPRWTLPPAMQVTKP